jgi:hypothetical protein
METRYFFTVTGPSSLDIEKDRRDLSRTRNPPYNVVRGVGEFDHAINQGEAASIFFISSKNPPLIK